MYASNDFSVIGSGSSITHILSAFYVSEMIPGGRK
jgi:hypothetical protein